MIFDDVIATRRSIRKFKSTPIEHSVVTKLIETARISPSAKNRQPWYFSVIDGEEKNRLADGMRDAALAANNKWAVATAEIIKSAPLLITVYLRKGGCTSDILSIGGAMYAICLKATDLGLGSLWIADTDVLSDCEEFSNLFGAIAIGYAAEHPSRRPRLPLEEISNLSPEVEEDTAADDDPFSLGEPDRNFVFVSYSHKNSAIVTADAIELKKHGIPLWYDYEMEKGAEWDKQAIAALENEYCQVFLFYVSGDSLRSPAVFEEFKAARRLLESRENFSILPILIGESSTAVLLDGLRRDGLDEYAREYASYFTGENKMLCILRSLNPKEQTHIEECIAYSKSRGIIDDPKVYESFFYEIHGGACVITGYSGSCTEVIVPEKISGLPVVEIGPSAFAEKDFIRSVSIPRTVKRLGLGTFRATGLREICIPDTVTEIQTACFRDCIHLEKISLPPHITYIAEATFRGCASLLEITVPEGVVELEEAAFRSCSSLRVARMPSTLRKMTEGGFWGCSSLEELIIPEEVEGVEIQSFDTSPLLKRVTVGGFVFEYGKSTPIA